MKLDDIGKKDYMAIILSKEELNIKELNSKISKSQALTYEMRIQEALYQDLIPVKSVQFGVGSDGVTAKFSASSQDKSVVFMVMEINKQ
jgi:hypothetical protein